MNPIEIIGKLELGAIIWPKRILLTLNDTSPCLGLIYVSLFSVCYIGTEISLGLLHVDGLTHTHIHHVMYSEV